jgi:hypothetical protein
VAQGDDELATRPLVNMCKFCAASALVPAAPLVAEIGDQSRFANPKQLMSWPGLVPSEHSRETTNTAAQSPRLATARPVQC